jgi:hypothetical protein
MNLEKVVFGFFIILAMTLNFGFFIGDLTDPAQHDVIEMFAAIAVNLIATVLKFGDRTQIGAIHLASSLVADLHLIAAAIVWAVVVHVTGAGHASEHRQHRLARRRGAARERGLGGDPGGRNGHDAPVGRRAPWAGSSSSSCGAYVRRCSP